MKISDNGFSERITTPNSRTQSANEVSRGSSSSTSSSRSASSDSLQLSSFAAKLQSTPTVDSSRASRIASITKAVQSNSFQVDPLQISRAMISEAVSSTAG
jgi:anti-sigma28 factor (negative regulator of flagellin synthesis)